MEFAYDSMLMIYVVTVCYSFVSIFITEAEVPGRSNVATRVVISSQFGKLGYYLPASLKDRENTSIYV